MNVDLKQSFKSFWKVAKDNGMSYQTYWHRVKVIGMNPKEAATTPVKTNKAIDHKWRLIAKKNNINISTYRSRRGRGWSCEKAATEPVEIQKRKDQYWLDIARNNGISYDTYSYRVDELFWEPEKAANTKPMSFKERSKLANELQNQYNEIENKKVLNDENNLFTINKLHLEIAQENGIPPRTAQARVHAYGWTVQDAITKPVTKPKFEKPKGYEKYLEIALANGFRRDSFLARVKRGWSLERASTEPLKIKGYYQRSDGEWIEKAKKNGIPYGTYTYRVNVLNWTKEEASTVKPLGPGEYLNEETAERSREGFKKFKGVK